LGFNLFSKEKEGGTLRILMSTNSSLWSILQGKALALYQLTLQIVAPMMLLSVVAMWWAAGTASFTEGLPALILALLFYLLYFALWVMGSLWVSTWAQNSSVALVTLLGFWVLGTFFMPRVSGSVAKAAFATPSSFSFSQNVKLDGELGIDRKTPAKLRKKMLDEQLLREYKVDSLSQLPIDYRGVSLEAGEDYGKLIYEKNYGDLHQKYQKQDAMMAIFNVFSPVLAMRSVSSGLSGTDLNRHLDFTNAAEQHRLLIAKTMNVDIQKKCRWQTQLSRRFKFMEKSTAIPLHHPLSIFRFNASIFTHFRFVGMVFRVLFFIKKSKNSILKIDKT
jgi:ABC-2 type transport system permease protein